MQACACVLTCEFVHVCCTTHNTHPTRTQASCKTFQLPGVFRLTCKQLAYLLMDRSSCCSLLLC